jgi:uncharacterized membrane protein YtjA (UPF0391 family)
VIPVASAASRVGASVGGKGRRRNALAEYGGNYEPAEMGTDLLVISLVAGALGFTGVARGAAQISKILFFVFLVIFLVILILAISAGQLIF